MKHTKEKGRAPPKGRRRLEFGAPKQQLPLLNKAVYMDIKNSRQADFMEEQLKKLGARVEKFLSGEVNYVISSSGPSKPDEKLSREENPQSPSFVPSPFNCGPSPAGHPEAKTVVVSRGKALAQIACAKNKASSVVTSAEKLGIKVVSADAATKWLEKEIRKMKHGMETSVKENKSKKAEVKLKESKTKSKLLTGSFIKVEDCSRHYRPVKVELDRWPRLNLSAPPGICPFGEAKIKVQNLYGARNQHLETSHVAGCVAVPAVPSHAAPIAEEEEEEARSVQKPATQVELVGVPIATTGDAKRILNFHFKKNLAINKQQGYCDCCGVKFQNIDEHLKGEEHRSFARQKSNYESLDALISQIPSTVDFLQSVLLKHCVQRHEEPTVSSCPSTQFVNLMAPISPLTTEKTNVPSLETAATCLKTPDPSGQDIATFKEHLTITDTDLISKRDTVTPTKQEPIVDSRPQAVVIRRPMPSGMFTSPRRRPITPSKKPWMQERSMVFSDSPIGSLQPSPCTSKETLPNFLCDNTVNSLNRLPSVCDKSYPGEPSRMPEASKVTKNLFSIILNQNFAKLRKKKSVTAQLNKKVRDAYQSKVVADEQGKELQSCHLEASGTDAERGNFKHSSNDNMTAEDDKVASFHDEKLHSVAPEPTVEHNQIQENIVINKESEVNDFCDEKMMTAKHKSELSDIHNEECITVTLSHQTNNLVVDEEGQMKDSENKSYAVEEEIKYTASFEEKCVNAQLENKVTDWNQELEMTAKQKQGNIDSCHDTGSSVEQEMECKGVIHKSIITVEQEVRDCNQDKSMTAKLEMERLDSSHDRSMFTEQEMKVTGNSEFVTVKQEMEKTESSHGRVVTAEMEKTESSHGRVVTAEMEKTESSHGRVVTAEMEKTESSHGRVVTAEMEKTESSHARVATAEIDMGKTESSHARDVTTVKDMGKTESSHARVVTAEIDMEKTESSHARDVTTVKDMGKTESSHARVVTAEMEKTESSHARVVTAEIDMEKKESSHARVVTAEIEMEKTESSHARVVTAEIEMGKTESSHARDVTAEKNMEKPASGHGTVVTAEHKMEVIGSNHEQTEIVEQEEIEKSNLNNGITVEQEQEVVWSNLDNNSITIEQEKEVTAFSHDNSITIEQERKVTGSRHGVNGTVEHEKEVTEFSHDVNGTIEHEKEVTESMHEVNSTIEQEKEVTESSHDVNSTIEQEKEVTESMHEVNSTIEQEKEVTESSHDVNSTIEENEMTGINHDNDFTVEQEKVVMKFSHDNSIPAEQEKEVTESSHGDSITIEENEVTGINHDNDFTVEQEKLVMKFSHDNSIPAEQEKEVTESSHGDSITMEENEVTGINHDNDFTVEQEKEVTRINLDVSITVEQKKEVTRIKHDNGIIVEQEKVGRGYCNDKIMTVGNRLSVTEIHCWERIAVHEKDTHVLNCEKSIHVGEALEKKDLSREESVAFEEEKKDPSHKESVTSEEEKRRGNSDNEKCETFVDKNKNTTKDIICEGSATFEQAYTKSNENITVEQEMEEICSKQDNNSTLFVLEKGEVGSTPCKGKIDEEEIQEKGFCFETMEAAEGKKKVITNQEQMEDGEEEKAESSSNCEKEITVFEEDNDMVGSNVNKVVSVEQHDQVTNPSYENRKVARQGKEETDFNLGKGEFIENVIIATKYDNVVNFSNTEKCEVIENKEKRRSDVIKRLTDEEGKRMKDSSHEQIIAVEENKKKKVYNHEKDKSVERRKERKSSNYEKVPTFEEKEMPRSPCTEGMTAEKRKDRTRSSHDKYASNEEKNSPVGSKYDAYVLFGNNEAPKSSDDGKRLIDEQNSNMKLHSHEKSTAVDEKRKLKASNCEKEKSVRRKKRKSSNYEKHFAAEEESNKDSNYDQHMAVENEEDNEISHHEKVLTDGQRSQKKGSNSAEKKSAERRRERNGCNHQRSPSVRENRVKGFGCKDNTTDENRKDRKRSDNEKHASPEETKSQKEPKHNEYKKEKGTSDHDKRLISEPNSRNKDSGREKYITMEVKKKTKASNCDKDKSVEIKQEKKRSNHERSLSVEEQDVTGFSCKDGMPVEKRKDRQRSNHEKHAPAEEIKNYIDSKHEESIAVQGNKEQELTDLQRSVQKDCSLAEYKSVEKRRERKRSNHEKHASAGERKRSKDLKHGRSIAVESNKEKDNSHPEKGLTDECRSLQEDSNLEEGKSEKRRERKRSDHEKHALAGERKKNKDSKHGESVAIESNKEKDSPLPEKGLTDEHSCLQKDMNLEEKSIEKRRKRKRSKHASAEEMKSHIDSKDDQCNSVEYEKEKESYDLTKRLIDKPRHREKDSSPENIAEDKKKTTVSKHREDKSSERNKERRSSNHNKHLSTEEKKRNNEHAAVDTKEKKQSGHEIELTAEQTRQQKGSKHDDGKSVVKRKEKKSSTHEKSTSVEETERKSSNCKEDMAVEKRKRSNNDKHLGCTHHEHNEYKKEKESSHQEGISIKEQRNRKKSYSPVKNIAVEEKKKGKVFNCEEDKSVERNKEIKITNCESVSVVGKNMTGSNYKEGMPVERKDSKSSQGKHLVSEEKNNIEKHAPVENKKEMKGSHHDKELTKEQRNKQKGYNQEEDKRKERKRSHEKYGATQEMKKHLDSKQDEHLTVEHKKEKESSDYEKRSIDKARNRKRSSSHGKHKAVEENKTKVSNCEKGKSDEKKKERKLSSHERSFSVEKKSTLSSCKEDTTIDIENMKDRKRSNHEKLTSTEEKKIKKDPDGVESTAVEKVAKKSSDHKNSSNVQREKNRKDSDNNKSHGTGRETQPKNMNPVVRISGRELGQCIGSDSLAETVYKHLAGRGLGAQAGSLIYVASHKDNIHNLLLKEGQILGQTSQQGLVSDSAHSSADQGLIKNKNGQSHSHKTEDRSANLKTSFKMCKDVHDSKIGKDVHYSKMCKDVHDSKIGKDVHDSKMCKDVHDSKIGKDVHYSKMCKDVHDSKIGKDVHGSKIGKDVHDSKISKDVHSSKISKDVDASKIGKDVHSSVIGKGVCGSHICMDVKRVCVGDAVKSNQESSCMHLDKAVNVDVCTSKTTDKTCANSLVCPSNTNRSTLLNDQPDICKTGTSSGKEVIDLHRHVHKRLQKRGRDFKTGKKACNVEKSAETDRQSLRGAEQIIRKVVEADSPPNNEFQNPNMKQSLEVVSVPGKKLNEAIYNSKDSYMDEDTVDTDFYESHKGGRKNNIVNTDESNNVHTTFPYITESRHFRHIAEPTSFPSISELLTTEPRPFPNPTGSVETENAVDACDVKHSDCRISPDQSIHQQTSTTNLGRHVQDKADVTCTENNKNRIYKNSNTHTSAQSKQIFSELSLESNIQQRNIEEDCINEDSISAGREMGGQLSEEVGERMNAASDEVSTCTITSVVIVNEQSQHHLREGGLVNEDDDTVSLISSEDMHSEKGNSDEGSDFIELYDQPEIVAVPNIAERVKSRSRVGCLTPSSSVGQGNQVSDEERKTRRKRKKTFREKLKNVQDSINSQHGRQICDISPKISARNVKSYSGDKHHKNTPTQRSAPAPIIPNIAESVKNRRSCTFFNHPGQYANSGEGSDGEDEIMKVKSSSAQKSRHKKYSSRERNLKALSLKSEAEYDKNGLVKHSRIVYSQNKSNDVKVDSSADMISEMEANGKTSNSSGNLNKTEDEASDLNSAVVVRRRKPHAYPRNKRPEVDWGKVQPSDGSSEQDHGEDNLWGLVEEKPQTCAQSDCVPKASHERRSHSITGSQARLAEFIREAKVVLVDINTSPYANTHTKGSLNDHLHVHTGASSSTHHTNTEAKTSSSYPNILTSSPNRHYPTDIHIKASTSPYTNIHVNSPTSHYTDNEDLAIHRSRYRTAKPLETRGQTPCAKCPHPARCISEMPSSPGISCSPRLRLKIRRRSGNKGFSSTLEEIHDCVSADIGCSAQVDTEHCGNSCECHHRCEEKYSSRIHHSVSPGHLTQNCMGRGSSPDMPGDLPQEQYVELTQPVFVKSGKRKREPCSPYSSDSESTLEYPLNLEAINKRIKLSPGNWAHLDIDFSNPAENQNQISPCVTAGDTSITSTLPRDYIRPLSPNRLRSSSPCFSSPITTRHFQCLTTPKKSHVPDKPAVSSESPVFKLSRKQLRHMQSLHSSASSLQSPQMEMSGLALKNAGLEANAMLDSSMKQAAGRHPVVKRLLSQPELDFPCAKKTKVHNSCCLDADSSVPLLESKQEAYPLGNFTESSNCGFHSLFHQASKQDLDFKPPVCHVLSSNRSSTSERGAISILPLAGTSQSHQKHFDPTEWTTGAAKDRNMKQAAAHPSGPGEDMVMLLDIETFSGVSELGFEDLLNQLQTFSSPEKATDTSWGDICDSYLSTSFNNHNTHSVGQPVLGRVPAGREARVVACSPRRKQFKNYNSPLRKRTLEESERGQTDTDHEGHIHKQKTQVPKHEADCPRLDTAVQQELQTPVKHTAIENLNLSPYIQQVDDVISFNFMSPQRLKSSPQDTPGSSSKYLLSPQTEHQRSHTVSHSRRLFSPEKLTPRRVQPSPHQTHRSSIQSLSSPPREQQRSNAVSHSRCLFSPTKTSTQRVTHSPHQTHRSSTQSLPNPQAQHQKSHTVSHPKRLFSPAKTSAADQLS